MREIAPYLMAGAFVAAVAASLHAILYKRDVRASIGWAGFIWIAPYIGPLIYLLFGVNRIQRRAGSLRARTIPTRRPSPPCALPPQALTQLAGAGDRICSTSLVSCNRIEPLSGSRAFDTMIERIDAAGRSVSLATYIFELDTTGRRVIDALARAADRGVEVRVLVDSVGTPSKGRRVRRDLQRRGIRVARFLMPRNPAGILSINLRNHRKLLVTDGSVAFTGGMNISDGYAMLSGARNPIRDVQFRVEGPAVGDLQSAFATDWEFTTGEVLSGDTWFPSLAPEGRGVARVIADGPDEDFGQTRWLILAALAAAQRTVRIATPYFLPDGALITALNVAALRGVDVHIAIPERLDHQFVKWASNALLWQVLEKGCRIWFTPAPFDHSKLFTVDGSWTLFGSSNWDARSLRLNFELNVEAHDADFARRVEVMIDEQLASGREITLAEMDARTFPVRLRDSLARLFVPYL